MVVALPLFLGFFAAAAGIMPPGMINMTAAKVSLNDGRVRAIVFALGASLVVFFQTIIAVLFAQFIYSRPEVIVLLREIGLVVFVLLTAYFFWAGKKTKPKTDEIKLKSKRGRFFLGILLSALNVFPIPYYVFLSITLSSYGYFFFDKPFVYTFVMGTVLGSFSVFYCYITFFKKMEAKTSFLLEHINYVIGSITGLVSLLTLFNIVQYYFT